MVIRFLILRCWLSLGNQLGNKASNSEQMMASTCCFWVDCNCVQILFQSSSDWMNPIGIRLCRELEMNWFIRTCTFRIIYNGSFSKLSFHFAASIFFIKSFNVAISQLFSPFLHYSMLLNISFFFNFNYFWLWIQGFQRRHVVHWSLQRQLPSSTSTAEPGTTRRRCSTHVRFPLRRSRFPVRLSILLHFHPLISGIDYFNFFIYKYTF